MTLTLGNFKQAIDSTILQRGRQYVRAGHVIDLEETDDGVWSAQVEGTEVYEVSVERGAQGELSWECTCPYDWGPVCKHVAAVLYAIEETFPEYLERKPRKPRKKRQTREDKVRGILQRLAHEELVELLAELAREDRRVANLLLARFGEEGDDKKATIQLVKGALNLGKGQYGFIDYWGAMRAARGVHEVLSRGSNLLRRGQANQAALIAQAVIETVIPALGQADDSNGALGGCVEAAVEMLEKAAATLEDTERRALFEYCLAEAPGERHAGWDWGWDLAGIAAGMIATEEERVEVFAMLDRMAERRESQAEQYGLPRLSEYDEERAALIKLSIIERDDDEQARLAFIKQHVHLHAFRQMLIAHHFEQNELAEVRRLCDEWLETRAGRSPGWVSTYLGFLLEVAQREKDDEEVTRLARKLFFNTGRFEYYDLLKQTVPQAGWAATVRELAREAERQPRGYYLLPEILVREEMWDALLALAKQHTGLVERYREHLEPRFPAEVCEAYEGMVFKMLERTTGRGTYAAAAEYLRRMQKMGQGERVEEIVELMVSTYSNRRAMIEELNRVRGG